MNKKPIYKRKWFIAIIVFVVLSVAFGGGESSSKTKSSPTKSEKSVEVSEKTCQMGDLLTVGKMEYRVLNKTLVTELGTKYLNKKAQGVYLLLNIEITNRSNRAVTVSDDFFKLKNNGKTYETSDDASIYLGDKSIIFKEVNPDTTLKGQICFDLNTTVANDNNNILEVQTGIWGTEKGCIALKKA